MADGDRPIMTAVAVEGSARDRPLSPGERTGQLYMLGQRGARGVVPVAPRLIGAKPCPRGLSRADLQPLGE
jgi:hypothetical protein